MASEIFSAKEAKVNPINAVKKSIYESKRADAYDKGTGKIGDYSKPTHATARSGRSLYYRLKENRHFGFKNGMESNEIMEQLKDNHNPVDYSYHDNAGTNEIYRIKIR